MFRDLSVDTRATALFGWGEIDRSNNQDDNGAYLVGFFTETDFRSNTLNLDFIYVFNSDDFGDGWYAGISSTQRIGHYNTAFRVNVSRAMDQRNAAVDDGILLFAEVSRTLPYSEDFVYATSFLSLDNYTSAARSPLVGGPLGRAGILFAAIGLGTYGTPLSNRADNTMGGALGYQMFFNNQRTNLVLELGGRTGTDGREDASVALGARLQFAIGARSLIQFDAFVAGNEGRDDGAGLRSEYLLRF
jgi:hypothetical protein